MTLQIPLAKIVIPPPPPQPTYTLVGLVIDSNRNPVGQAVIRGCCINDSPVDGMFGLAETDGFGQFRLVTTRWPDSVWVFRRGYQDLRATVARFPAGSTANITVVVARFVRLVLTPVSVRVGQTVRISGSLETDSGSRVGASIEELTSDQQHIVDKVRIVQESHRIARIPEEDDVAVGPRGVPQKAEPIARKDCRHAAGDAAARAGRQPGRAGFGHGSTTLGR